MNYLKPQSPLQNSGTSDYIYPLTIHDQLIINDDKKLNDYSVTPIQEHYFTLSSNNWIKDNHTYLQIISIEGLTESYNVKVKLNYSNNLKTNLKIKKSANYINYAKQYDNKIIFYCLRTKPLVNIPIEVEVSV